MTLSVICPEIYHWVAQCRAGANLQETTCRATLSPGNLLAEQISQQGLSQRLTRSFVAKQFDIGSNSSSDTGSDSSTDYYANSFVTARH
jgi:hypothetical protein